MKILNSLPLRQRGITLVEIMVSVTIGMVIVLFVSSMYVSSRGSQRISDDNMRLQEEAQIAMNLIGRNLMQAGFGTPTSYKNANFADKALIGCDHGFDNPKASSASPACSASATGSAGFQVGYRVEGTYSANTGAAADCNGKDASASGVVFNRFYIATRTGDATPSLYCSGSGDFNDPQPVLGNVEDLRLTYGEDTNSDQSADVFRTSAADVSDTSWKSVVNVNVCLQVSSDNLVATGTQQYVDCSGVLRNSPDRRLRLVLNRVFTLRNNAASSNLLRS